MSYTGIVSDGSRGERPRSASARGDCSRQLRRTSRGLRSAESALAQRLGQGGGCSSAAGPPPRFVVLASCTRRLGAAYMRTSIERVVAGLASIVLAGAAWSQDETPRAEPLGTLYVVGYAHLDTQWRWTYPQTIREFL